MELIKVPINKIVIPGVRASASLTEDQLRMLEGSIKQYGIVQPVILRKLPDGSYELVAGKNRLEEAKKAGNVEIDSIILDISQKNSITLHLIENLARGEVNDMDIAKVLKKAISSGMTIEEIAKMLNHSVEWVKDRLMLLELPEEYQQAVKHELLSIGHIKQALRLDDSKEMEDALATAVSLKWPVTTMKTYVENRMAQLEAMKQVKEEGIKPPEITSIPKEQLSTVEQCFVCNEFVEKNKMTWPKVCEECRMMAEYVVRNLGKGMSAMQKIYQAMQMYDTYMKAKKLEAQLKLVESEKQKETQVMDEQ